MCELVLVAEADQFDYQMNIIPDPVLGNRPREQGIRGQLQVVQTNVCRHVQAHAVRCAMPVLPLDPLGVQFEGATNDCSWMSTKIYLSYQKLPKGFPQYKVLEVRAPLVRPLPTVVNLLQDFDYGICRRDGTCVWAREYEPERQVVLYCSRCATWFHRECLRVVDNLLNVRRRRLVRHSRHLEWHISDEEKDNPAAITTQDDIEQDLRETTGARDADIDAEDGLESADESGWQVSHSRPSYLPTTRDARPSSLYVSQIPASEDEDASLHSSLSPEESSEVDQLDHDTSDADVDARVEEEEAEVGLILDEDQDDDDDERNLWRAILQLPIQRGYPELAQPSPLSFEILLLAARALHGRPRDVDQWVSATYQRSYVHLPPHFRAEHKTLFWKAVSQPTLDRIVYRCPRGHFV